jgi:hypothetical protein
LQSYDSEDSSVSPKAGERRSSPTGSTGSGHSLATPTAEDEGLAGPLGSGELSDTKEEGSDDDLELDNFISGIGA